MALLASENRKKFAGTLFARNCNRTYIPEEKSMTRTPNCKLLFLAAVSVGLLLPVQRANAQDAATAGASASGSQAVIYDASKEITVSGAISKIETLSSGEFFGS